MSGYPYFGPRPGGVRVIQIVSPLEFDPGASPAAKARGVEVVQLQRRLRSGLKFERAFTQQEERDASVSGHGWADLPLCRARLDSDRRCTSQAQSVGPEFQLEMVVRSQDCCAGKWFQFPIEPRAIDELERRRLSLLRVEDAENWLAILVEQLEANRVGGSLPHVISPLLTVTAWFFSWCVALPQNSKISLVRVSTGSSSDLVKRRGSGIVMKFRVVF